MRFTHEYRLRVVFRHDGGIFHQIVAADERVVAGVDHLVGVFYCEACIHQFLGLLEVGDHLLVGLCFTVARSSRCRSPITSSGVPLTMGTPEVFLGSLIVGTAVARTK